LKIIKRIAMWSGPRNLSTALMRSFGNRGDFEVIDEPFYASYLKETGLRHPMYKEILKSRISNHNFISKFCSNGPVGKPYQYQKHMTHHMLDNFNKDFIFSVTNVFLIRRPDLVLMSFKKKHKEYEFNDLGFRQQFELFELVADKLGHAPPVVDSNDLINNTKGILKKLCSTIEIRFLESMLSWNPGPKSYDGIWGRHWYSEINKSSRFRVGSIEKKPLNITVPMSSKELGIIEIATKYYNELQKIKIKAN